MNVKRVTYDSNNSGGVWWLKDDDWLALEEAGWIVHWGGHSVNPEDWADAKQKGERWLKAAACSAHKYFLDPDEGIREWESITLQNSNEEGCECCGPPHSFTVTEDEVSNHALAEMRHAASSSAKRSRKS